MILLSSRSIRSYPFLLSQSRESSPDDPPLRDLFNRAEDEGSLSSGGDEVQNTL